MSFNTNASARNIEALLLQQYLRSKKLTHPQQAFKQALIARTHQTFCRQTQSVTSSSVGGAK